MGIDEIRQHYDVTEAKPEHALAMAPIMRPADRGEIWAASGLDPLTGLQVSLDASLYAWTWRVDGVPACMFGVTSADILSGVGAPWLLSSELVNRHWRPFLKHYRPFLDQMRADFPVLSNWVDARYETAVHWLRWMGFEIMPAEPYGPFGLPHHRFEMRKQSVTVRKCAFAEIAQSPNFPALFNEYAAECAIVGLPVPDEKIATYPLLEQSGFFQSYGAFLGEKLVGFVAVLMPVIPHYGTAVTISESFFVAKAYRKRGAGIKLLRAAEQHARQAGSPGLLVSAPYGGQLAEVLPRLGYRETNRVFFKEASDV